MMTIDDDKNRVIVIGLTVCNVYIKPDTV
jgi:hypothetical protein